MAKKPTIDTSELTDEEIIALAAPAVAPVVPEAVAPVVPAHFVTSFNQASLVDVNAYAIAEAIARNALLSEAHKTALIAVNKAFAGTGAPMGLIEAAATSRK